jgi:mono/diheme cytochrome c family protein
MEASAMNRLGLFKKLGLLLIPMVLVSLAWGGPTRFFPAIQETLNPPRAPEAPLPPDGAKLFLANCAYCHGEKGDGNGIASLSIKARYFGAEPYKFGTTTGTRIPTDDNLLAVLKRGIAGSSMPSFAHLRDDELQALISHLRVLTRRGMYDQFVRKAEKEMNDGGDEPDPVKLSAKVKDLCKIGTPFPTPKTYSNSSPESLARGKKVFMASCASCHGPEGLGNGPQVKDLKNDNGTPAVPRNLVGGVFKGGGEKPSLYARIMLGIPGTPMPAGTTLKPEEVDDLLNYVLSLSQSGH